MEKALEVVLEKSLPFGTAVERDVGGLWKNPGEGP